MRDCGYWWCVRLHALAAWRVSFAVCVGLSCLITVGKTGPGPPVILAVFIQVCTPAFSRRLIVGIEGKYLSVQLFITQLSHLYSYAFNAYLVCIINYFLIIRLGTIYCVSAGKTDSKNTARPLEKKNVTSIEQHD